MAILDRLKFDASDNDILVWKHPSESLRLGSQLIVNESQDAGQRLSDTLGKFVVEQSVSVFQLAARLSDLSLFSKNVIAPELEQYGIELASFSVESVSIPEEETKKFQEVLGRKMEIEQISSAQMSDTYLRMRQLDAIDKAVEVGGTAGDMMATGLGLGLGVGAGIESGRALGDALKSDPPKAKETSSDPRARLQELKTLHDDGLLSDDEFEAKRREIIDAL